MADRVLDQRDAAISAVAEYKRIFKDILENRPSGMRIKLAHAMGKNRSFISQISNPNYPVPIPVQHLNTIFEVCRFLPAAKAAFLEAYARAHPRRLARLAEVPRERTILLHLPDLGSQKRNEELDALLQDFAKRLNAIVHEDKLEAGDSTRQRGGGS